MTRLAQTFEVAIVRAGDRVTLTSPMPGWFRPALAAGAYVTRGTFLGELIVLAHHHRLVAGDVHGVITAGATLTPRAVDYGAPLVELDTAAALAGDSASGAPAAAAASATGLVFRAPTSGRFYGRPAPDKPAFVNVGDELSTGATVCLLEVMKTFHRVTYGGDDLPERARVRELLVLDGADVTAGDPLLALD